MEREKLVQSVLRRLSMTAGYTGYTYIRDAILMVLESTAPAVSMDKGIYTPLSKKYNVTTKSVARCIRHLISICYKNTSEDNLIEILGGKERQSNKYFIAIVAEYIAIREKSN